jgi:hypothetical protein
VKDNSSFLSRWSQRKTEQQGQTEESEVQEIDSSQNQQLETLETQNQSPTDTITDLDSNTESTTPSELEEPQLTDEDMPDIDTLDQDSDFKQFLSPGVSEELRGLALRKLFLLPEFNIRDGLNDYDEDFSKMPELTKAVVDKLRSWVNEKEEEIKTELSESLESDDDTTTEHSSEETDKKPEDSITSYTNEYEETDDLGDADLEG